MEHAPPLRRLEDPGPNLARIMPMRRVSYKLLDPNVRYLWLIGRLIFWLFVSAGLVVFGVVKLSSGTGFNETMRQCLIILAVLLPLFIWHISWSFIAYKHWGYAIRKTDFLIRTGVLWKRVMVVPFARIQHVDSGSGMFDRMFGVANLTIHTAGSRLGSLGVPGLPEKEAESLRDYLSEVGHTHANI